MNYGLYVSASGVLTNLYRQDVFANNLANARTVAFKPDLPAIRQRDPESLEGAHPHALRHPFLDELSGGVFAGRQAIAFSPGAPRPTGNPLDVALTGSNAFLPVRATDPDTGKQTTMLTRDGRLQLNDRRELILAGSGHLVLGEGDQPITVANPGRLAIDPRGQLTNNGEVVGRLQVVGVNDLERLIKQGRGLYAVTGAGEWRTAPDVADLRPGQVEDSAVDPIQALMELMDATRAVSSNGNLIKYHDQLTDRAVNVLGRVSA